MSEAAALLALLATLAAAIARPRLAPDWAVAALCAAALVATGVLSADDARDAAADLWSTLAFLAALLVLADGCREAGLFEAPGAAAGDGVRDGLRHDRGAQPRRHGAPAHAGRVRHRGAAAHQRAPARLR